MGGDGLAKRVQAGSTAPARATAAHSHRLRLAPANPPASSLRHEPLTLTAQTGSDRPSVQPMHADTGNDTDSGSNEVEQTAVPALSCYRLSPRPCANQALVDELKPLREFRFLRYGSASGQTSQDRFERAVLTPRRSTAHAPEAISYATAVSCIIGTPFVIETVEQAAKIPKVRGFDARDPGKFDLRLSPQVGEKLKLKIQEFLDHGFIQESREVRQSERYQVLKLLTSVHDVGKPCIPCLPQSVRQRVDARCRPRRLCQGERAVRSRRPQPQRPASRDEPPAHRLVPQVPRRLAGEVRLHPLLPSLCGDTHLVIPRRIPRSEVESILKFVEVQLNKVKPGFKTLLCGGRVHFCFPFVPRRFAADERSQVSPRQGVLERCRHPHHVPSRRRKGAWSAPNARRSSAEEGSVRRFTGPHTQLIAVCCLGVCRTIGRRAGLIPPDGLLTLTTCGTDRVISSNRPATLLDALDKALIIFKHPANATTRPQDKYRRVDLVVTTWKGWGSAVVGWTGSTQFERDLRRHAKKMCVTHVLSVLPFVHRADRVCELSGYKFDSGGIRTQQTDEPVEAVTEKDVFRVLGLEYIPCVSLPPLA